MLLARDPEQPRRAVRRSEMVTYPVPFNAGNVDSAVCEAP